MKSTRFYKILVVLLVLINLVSVYFLMRGPKNGPPDRNELVVLLDLKGPKKDKILQMQDKHFHDKHLLIERSRNLHEKLFQLFSDESKDSTDVQIMISKIVENQREIEQMTFDYFKEVDALCTKEQQEKLQTLLHEVLRRAGGPPRP